ncbi:RNA polymerase sigma factor [Wukongibacter sp. M2B1]|uniref:RNA polymerase sigma factor n=1 Tax=Wukongibacter sp. M2B1 TaxID=3088895 RepID=UPI003D7B9F60
MKVNKSKVINYGRKEYQYILYKKYYKDVFRTVYYIVKDKEIAKDLTHDAFLKAYKNVESLREIENIRAWLCTIASNLSKNYLRRNKKFTMLELHSESHSTDDFVDEYVLDKIERKNTQEKVRNLLNELDPDSKEILSLRYYQELPYSNISEILSLNLGTVKSKISRAKKKIFNMLKEEGEINEKRAKG